MSNSTSVSIQEEMRRVATGTGENTTVALLIMIIKRLDKIIDRGNVL